MINIQVKLFDHNIHINNSLNEYIKSQDGYIPPNITMVNPFILWNQGYTGKDVTIAIIDTGCSRHSDLDKNIIGGRNFTTEGKSDDYSDGNGHGTHVSGIIGANGKLKGIAPDSKLLILKVLDKSGNGNMESVVNAVNYAIDKKVNIINMSLGCPTNVPELHTAVKRAIDNNIVIVSASGNNGDNNANTYEIDYPSGYNEVISVGAIDSMKMSANFTNSNKEVDCIAPGVNIISTSLNNGYIQMDGTSMASPHVAGIIALLKQWSTKEFGRVLTESELYAQLIKNTIDLGIPKTIQGNGLICLK